MSNTWMAEVFRGTFSTTVLRNPPEVSIEDFVDDFITWCNVAYWKSRTKSQCLRKEFKFKRSIKNRNFSLLKSRLKNVVDIYTDHTNFHTIAPTVMDRQILAPKQENRVESTDNTLCKSFEIVPNLQKHVANASTVKLNNWLPVVNVSNRLKSSNNFQTLSVRIKDISKSHKSRINVSVLSNFGCDQETVKVSRSMLKANPQLFRKKAFVRLEDILEPPPNLILTKNQFLAYFKLHHIDSPTTKRAARDTGQKYLRSCNTSNIPWSSELGKLLRKPMHLYPLVRLERTERFINTTTNKCTSETYPVTYSTVSEPDYHIYKFPNRQQHSKHLSLKTYACMNVIKPVSVHIGEKEMEAVKQKLKQKL